MRAKLPGRHAVPSKFDAIDAIDAIDRIENLRGGRADRGAQQNGSIARGKKHLSPLSIAPIASIASIASKIRAPPLGSRPVRRSLAKVEAPAPVGSSSEYCALRAPPSHHGIEEGGLLGGGGGDLLVEGVTEGHQLVDLGDNALLLGERREGDQCLFYLSNI